MGQFARFSFQNLATGYNNSMINIFLTLGVFVLILVSLFLMLVILMQRASSSGGLGAAFGGGVADSAFGADTGNILTKATIWATVAFFTLSLLLYLGFMSTKRPEAERQLLTPAAEMDQGLSESPALPVAPAPEATTPTEESPDPDQ